MTLVTKDVLEHANTRYAQGGIAGVMFPDDRVQDHVRDTLVAGAGLSDPDAVRVLVDEGPARIRELIALGVAFDRDAAGGFVKGLEAAHSYPRILHAGGDATGTAIEKALVAGLRASDVTVIEHAFLVGLVLDEVTAPTAGGRRVTGVELLIGETDAGPGRRETLHADAVVLATGGAGELYAHSTNPEVATGDGIAAAIRAGADVADLEFFQFHPTVLEGKADAAGLASGSRSWCRRPCAARARRWSTSTGAASSSTPTPTASSRPATSSPGRSRSRWRLRAGARCSSTRRTSTPRTPTSAPRSSHGASRRSTAPCASGVSTGRASRSR